MLWFVDILKIRSVIEVLNSYETNTAVFRDNYRTSLIQALLHLKLVMYCDGSKFKQIQSQQPRFFDLLDKKQYKTNFQNTVISLFRSVNSNLEILLIRNKFIKNDAIKWLPAFH